MAVDQLASMLNVPTSSRASSLPHWMGGEPRFLDWHSPPVGAGLLAKALDQLAVMLNVLTSSRTGSPTPSLQKNLFGSDTLLPTHAGLFSNSNFLIFSK